MKVLQSLARSMVGGRCVLVLAAALACGGDDPNPLEPAPPSADEDPVAPEADHRVLPEGMYHVRYHACDACPRDTTPDYLLVFAGGVDGVVTIGGATRSGATVVFHEMRAADTPAFDLLRAFNTVAVTLDWNDGLEVFEGFVHYATGAFLPTFHRDGDRLRCGFDVFHLKYDIGQATCTVED